MIWTSVLWFSGTKYECYNYKYILYNSKVHLQLFQKSMKKYSRNFILIGFLHKQTWWMMTTWMFYILKKDFLKKKELQCYILWSSTKWGAIWGQVSSIEKVSSMHHFFYKLLIYVKFRGEKTNKRKIGELCINDMLRFTMHHCTSNCWDMYWQ